MNYWSSAFFYLLLLIICCLLCREQRKGLYFKGVILAYILLSAISFIRYDVGWDYVGYYHIMNNAQISSFQDIVTMIISSSGKVSEPFFIILCFLFQDFEDPAIWIFGIYASLTFIFLYCAVEDIEQEKSATNHKWAIIAIFIFYFLFLMWDAIRQALAISITLFSIRYIKEGKFLPFLLIIIMACTVHLSAFFFLPAYFIRRVYLSKRVSVFMVSFFILLYVLGAFSSLISLAEHVPYYSRYIESDEHMRTVTGYSTLTLLKFIMWILMVLVVPKDQKPYNVFLTIGICLYILASGAQVFERVADYYYYSVILLFPLMAKQRKSNKFLFATLLLVSSFVCCFDMVVTQKRGVVPYQTIWSDNYYSGIEREQDLN